jgi:hypothetical protein
MGRIRNRDPGPSSTIHDLLSFFAIVDDLWMKERDFTASRI